MKIILVSINAKYIHTNNAVRLLKANSSFDIKILEFTIKDDYQYIIESIKKENADVVGFSMYIWNVTIFKKLISEDIFTNPKLILGGPEVSYESLSLAKKENVDYILKGEGELSFNALLKAIKENKEPNYIDGITYYKDDKLINNSIVEIKDLTMIKSPHYYEDDIMHIPNKISYIESSRGCPYKCSYCLSSLEKSVRFFDTNIVKEEILYLISKGSKTIKFLDRTFNANKNTFDLFEFIIKNNNNYTVFQFEITGDTLDRSIIDYLNNNAPKGLIRFEIGIQSTNKKTNLLVDRYQNNEVLFSNIKAIQDANIIDLHLDLIAGLPEEDIKSFEKTFNQVFRLGALELQLGFLKMLKGTKIRREAALYGYQYQTEAPYEVIENNHLSETEIIDIKAVEEMLDIHHNKGYFGKEMLKFILSQDSPFIFLYDIAKEYQKQEYTSKGYQIDEIYQRLFKFINNDEINNLIKLDYLSRSKIKPKIFWKSQYSKQDKNKILNYVSNQQGLNINNLYKHTVLLKVLDVFHIFYYKNFNSVEYIVKEKDITSV